MSSAVKPYNPSTGGTKGYERHTITHSKESGKYNGFPIKLHKSQKRNIADGAALAVNKSGLPVSLAESKNGLFDFVSAVFKAGLTLPCNANVDMKYFMPSAKTVKEAISRIVAAQREVLAKDTVS